MERAKTWRKELSIAMIAARKRVKNWGKALGNKGNAGRKFSALHKKRIARSQKARWARIHDGK